MRPTQAGNAGCEAKVPRALIARLRAWRAMLFVPLQHRGSSLTTSVRPRARWAGPSGSKGVKARSRGHSAWRKPVWEA